jgi:hypothetical protein
LNFRKCKQDIPETHLKQRKGYQKQNTEHNREKKKQKAASSKEEGEMERVIEGINEQHQTQPKPSYKQVKHSHMTFTHM